MLSTCASNLEKQRDDFVRLNGWETWDIDYVSSSSTGLHEFVSQRKATLEPVLKNRHSEGEWFLEHTDVLPRLVTLVKDTPRLVSLASGIEGDANDRGNANREDTDHDKETLDDIATLCHQMEVAIEYTELCEQVIGHIDEEISQCMSTVFEIKEKRLESSFTGQISASQLDHVSKEVYPWLTRHDRSIKETFCQLNDTKIKPLTVSLGFIPERVTQFSSRCQPIFPTFSSLVKMNWSNLEQQWHNLQEEFASVEEELSTKKWSSILQLAIDQISEDADAALLSVLQRVCNDKNMYLDEMKALSTKRLSTNSSIFSECSETTEMSEHGTLSPRLSFAPQFPVKRRLHMRVVSLDRFSPKPVIKRHSNPGLLQEINHSRLNQQVENDKLLEEQLDFANTSSSDWSNTSSSSVIVSTPDSDALESSEPVEPLREIQLPPPTTAHKKSPLNDMSVIMESLESVDSPVASPGEGTTLRDTKDSKCSCNGGPTPIPAIFSKFRSLKATKSFIPVTNSPNRLLHRYPQLGSRSSTPDNSSNCSLSSCSDTSFGSSIGSTSTMKLGEPPSLQPASSSRLSLIPLPSPNRPSSRPSSRLGSHGTPLATPTRKPRLSYSGAGSAGLSSMRSVSDTPVLTDASRRQSDIGTRNSSRRSSFLPSPVKRQSLVPPSTPQPREGYNSYHTGRVSREGIRGTASRDGMSLANAGVRIAKPVIR
ncbi:hypothetical protein CJU90_2414 [Yarrowia sp. C11]|nr:hypothetical protein CKK34_6441 [Yarrowia sp. E02]KAG5372327.1 hypothetical protein CJU90_2414 [Yarrowia sp. C11]